MSAQPAWPTNLSERKPQELLLRRKAGEFGLVIVLDSGYELGIKIDVQQYVNLRDNEGIAIEPADRDFARELRAQAQERGQKFWEWLFLGQPTIRSRSVGTPVGTPVTDPMVEAAVEQRFAKYRKETRYED